MADENEIERAFFCGSSGLADILNGDHFEPCTAQDLSPQKHKWLVSTNIKDRFYFAHWNASARFCLTILAISRCDLSSSAQNGTFFPEILREHLPKCNHPWEDMARIDFDRQDPARKRIPGEPVTSYQTEAAQNGRSGIAL
jgi:hypothetical protein